MAFSVQQSLRWGEGLGEGFSGPRLLKTHQSSRRCLLHSLAVRVCVCAYMYVYSGDCCQLMDMELYGHGVIHKIRVK